MEKTRVTNAMAIATNATKTTNQSRVNSEKKLTKKKSPFVNFLYITHSFITQ